MRGLRQIFALCVSRYSSEKLPTLSKPKLFVYLFWLSAFFSVVMKLPMKTLLTHSFIPPTLLLSFNYEKSCQEAGSSCKDGVGGLSCSKPSTAWSPFCIPDAFVVCPRTFKIFFLKVSSLLASRSSSVHHGLIITPLLDAHKHIFNITTL